MNWSRLLGAVVALMAVVIMMAFDSNRAAMQNSRIVLVSPGRGPSVICAHGVHGVGASCSVEAEHRVEGVRDLKKEESCVPSKGAVPANDGYVAKPSGHRDFEIVIICALELEYKAVFLMLREFWDEEGDLYKRPAGNGNTYTTGRIGRFNIVLVLSGKGKGPAVKAAENVRCSYPGLRLAILVGICGGVPRTSSGEEILLGDVIVSNTIVEYDLGTQHPDRFVLKKASRDNIGETNQTFCNILNLLRSGRLQSLLANNLHQLQTRAAEMGQGDIYSYPGFTHDNKKAHEPAIHIGRIASADTLMRSSKHRDEISAGNGVIAFDMEAAGVANVFPCIVIKGVSDYADSDKNDLHSNDAAEAAAAVLGAVLGWLAAI